MTSDDAVDGFERALAMVPSCALDADGRRSQRARYSALSRSIAGVRREPDVLVVEFEEPVDRAVVEEAIAVEWECCPSLQLELDVTARRLTVATDDTTMLPALDAVEAAFSCRSTRR